MLQKYYLNYYFFLYYVTFSGLIEGSFSVLDVVINILSRSECSVLYAEIICIHIMMVLWLIQ